MADQSPEKIRCKITATKQEILKTYKNHLNDLNDRMSQVATTDIIAKQKNTQKAVETAMGVKSESIEDQVSKLNKSVSKTLLSVLDNIGEKKTQFTQITEAIEAKKAELKEVYEIESETNTLAALVNAQNEQRIEAQKEIQDTLNQAREEASNIVTRAQERAQQINEQIKAQQEATQKQRNREEDEYHYNFERTKKQEFDKLNDELEANSKKLSAREVQLKEREAKVEELQSTVESLQKTLDTERATKQAEIEAAVEKAKKKAEASAAISANISRSKHESELKIKSAENTTLSTQVSDCKERIAALQKSLDAANGKVQEVAMTALNAKAEASRPLVVGGEQQNSKNK